MAASVGLREVLAFVQPDLERVGFHKRSGNIFTCEIAPGIIGTVGFSYATWRNLGVSVHPVVGVRHQRVEELRADLTGEKRRAYLPVTVVTPLVSLMPRGGPNFWDFVSPGPIEKEARSLVNAIVEYGLPWLTGTSTLDRILARIVQGAGIRDHLVFVRPIILSLLGRDEEAEADVRATLAECQGKTYPFAALFQRFAAAFLEAMPLGDRDPLPKVGTE